MTILAATFTATTIHTCTIN